MRTAGLVLDFYDDAQGKTLKEIYPEASELPEVIKVAHILSPLERNVLRDEAYALVLHNEGTVLRKFATVDAGNTALSVLYFLENSDKLPVEAQKVAAANLQAACEEFGIPVPLDIKVAAANPLSRTRDSMKQPKASEDNDWAQRTNLKTAPSGPDNSDVLSATENMKTSSVRRVDVSGLSPEPLHLHKTASVTALGGSYPLDSYSNVKDAIQFFMDHSPDLTPEERREYCVKTAARADELGIEMPEVVSRYGSSHYAPDLEAHLVNRKALCEPAERYRYEELMKVASRVNPETFAGLLGIQDESTGLNYFYGGELADYYYATFGGLPPEKVKLASWSWSNAAGDQIDALELAALSGDYDRVASKFTDEFAQAFSQDPQNIFDSMPDDSKTILARLALGKE